MVKYLVWLVLAGTVFIPKHSGDRELMVVIYFVVIFSLIVSFKLLKKSSNRFLFWIWFSLMAAQNVLYHIYSIISYKNDLTGFTIFRWDYLLWELVVPSLVFIVQLIFYVVYGVLKKFDRL